MNIKLGSIVWVDIEHLHYKGIYVILKVYNGTYWIGYNKYIWGNDIKRGWVKLICE